MERTISRSELHSPESTPEPAPDDEVVARLQQGLVEFDYLPHERDIAALIDDDVEGQLDFRLFATPGDADPTTKIRLRSPTPQLYEAGFVNSQRPRTCYFADATNKQQYESVSISGEQVKAMSQNPWPGYAYEWKVLHLPPSGQTRQARALCEPIFSKLLGKDLPDSTRRKRLGKKARIKLRSKLAVSRQKAETQRIDIEARELAERVKRARKNRDKKLKKRARDKAKKAEG
ncbi:hypothetical protein BAUCODRAFT_488137 [Baudoinia panamericana UAMH 10762]|uniref:Uncharacterized protein n=1 Tax=Baudoinia panamericana (strain UAMH 10762) TaxID=717646 RepID=M2MJ81_BAUPA|nr:uncharacterized protein BAUCODRAFT_488137 [Baudoinia panamericana UAMH 10762]EMC96736.1 hypothetical protein BAUCODRAFT_488137 [Baudoinia panamericana UAMH 10762]